ncbi:class I SAM-dependent methyltransferase [Agromyces atrinae]|jgi:SAM-dependent methyltransferase|uniref:SAM-dependent methyltransferase n=1 Tax=Agromyces atrinae TaxID=592376 RepID=A0A4Q2M7P4_9MICO|nr:class I SAM-dependent methyltransferase [Agromyces atrinae]NYD66672.1 SAM-dependent methyltransferase [Agromyces atrinae]RXZ87337.1 class I SAM-dependent methyltransferase [Agromyces atrinae]
MGTRDDADRAERELRSTEGAGYTDRLLAHEKRGWLRKNLDVQAPYRWDLKRLDLGHTLDVGCGLGRNLLNLEGGVGVDHNAESIAVARSRGLTAYTIEGFLASEHAVPESFDSLLFAHVLEHMGRDEGFDLVSLYLPFLKPGGRVCFITPQEAGYRSDPTHVHFVDSQGLRDVCERFDLEIERDYSFPFPRPIGHVFTFNQFEVVARKAPSVVSA